MDVDLFYKVLLTSIVLACTLGTLFFIKAVASRDDDYKFEANMHRFTLSITVAFIVCIIAVLYQIWIN